jgi:hypothetical protein
VHRGYLCPASARPTHCGRGAQHRPAHRATHLPMCHFAAHHTQKNTLIEFTVKNPSPGHIEWWSGRARRGLSKPIPAVQLDTYAASGAKFGPRWTSSSYPTNLTNLSTTPRPPLPNTRFTAFIVHPINHAHKISEAVVTEHYQTAPSLAREAL